MIEINLTASELMLAAQAGVMRQVENVARKQGQNTHGYDERNPWQVHIEGCCGEMAVSKALNQFWKGKGIRGETDVGDDDVRTRPRHDSELILHRSDASHRIFWHVTGQNGSYRIHGWTYAKDGKNEEYWGDPVGINRPAFFVPNKILISPEDHPLWPKNNSQTFKNF